MTEAELLDLAHSALLDATDAGARVFRPGDWPAQDVALPALKLRMPMIDKVSQGRASIGFTATASLRIIGQVTAPADEDEPGDGAAEAALMALARQVEVAVINSQPLTAALQQFPFIRTRLDYAAAGEKHVAVFNMDIGLEYYQGPDDFAPIATDDIEEAEVTIPDPPAGGTITIAQD